MTNKEKEIFDLYNKSGWVAFYYPRLKKISLNGSRKIPEKQAIEKMYNCLKENKLI